MDVKYIRKLFEIKDFYNYINRYYVKNNILHLKIIEINDRSYLSFIDKNLFIDKMIDSYHKPDVLNLDGISVSFIEERISLFYFLKMLDEK